MHHQATDTNLDSLLVSDIEQFINDSQQEFESSRMIDAISDLNERDRFVIEHRLAGETLEEVGVRMGLTRERVRQLEHRAICTLRKRCLCDNDA